MSTYTEATSEISKTRVVAFTALVNELERGMERVWIFRIGITDGVEVQCD